jgi:hypothetical protein
VGDFHSPDSTLENLGRGAIAASLVERSVRTWKVSSVGPEAENRCDAIGGACAQRLLDVLARE